MFYRPGGGPRINQQYDEVYSDTVNGATAFLPVNKGDWIAINACRASINYVDPATSKVVKVSTAPEAEVLLELKTIGGQDNVECWPIQHWQNLTVATGMRAHRSGMVRMRILSVNNVDGTGIAMALEVSRSGDSGASA